jgi:DNA-binding NtrC family response regulator
MTTALIGKHGVEAGCKARVALLRQNGATELAAAFARAGHELAEFSDWPSLLDAVGTAPFDLVLVDEPFADAPQSDPGCPVLALGERARPGLVALSATTLEHSIDAVTALASALTRSQARLRELTRLVDGIRTGTALVGHSAVARRMMTVISRAADCDAAVLVEGPAGAGKSLVARAIHCKSRRGNRPLAIVDGGAATADSVARALDQARGTTLIVEDVDKLPAPAQAVLVRHLKERAGSGTAAPPRLVATTSAHLPELVARGAFREDLFYRLHGLPIVVPALRERPEDVPLLARAILEQPTTSSHRTSTLTPAAVAQLERMSWPGNVTQLEATVRRAQLLAGGGPIDAEHLLACAPAPSACAAAATSSAAATDDDGDVTEAAVLPFEQEEQRMLTRALRATKGNVRRAAQLLGIGRATLYRKIQQYHLRLQ